ncbi:MAG: aminoglycoside phosphotransferase family protein [Clostridiales bacterium]|nr:aminoglycoside phosphotransferase family protein [Clostridiales bacterium]
MNQPLLTLLFTAYSLSPCSITQVQGGWAANAYLVISNQRHYFLKVFDKHRSTAQYWIQKIPYYISILHHLHKHTPFKKEIIMPICTKENSCWYENEDFLLMLYPYIQGEVLGDTHLSLPQQKELAAIIANLHLHGSQVPKDLLTDRETFDPSFGDSLKTLIKNNYEDHSLVQKATAPYTYILLESISKLQSDAYVLRKNALPYVLCHTDLHGWNLIQSKKLLLLDWEGLKFAPAEADLFSFSEGFFFDYALDPVIKTYQQIHPQYQINQTALTYYQLRRRIEDVTEFIQSILFDGLCEKKILLYLSHIEKEGLQLRKILSPKKTFPL